VRLSERELKKHNLGLLTRKERCRKKPYRTDGKGRNAFPLPRMEGKGRTSPYPIITEKSFDRNSLAAAGLPGEKTRCWCLVAGEKGEPTSAATRERGEASLRYVLLAKEGNWRRPPLLSARRWQEEGHIVIALKKGKATSSNC